ncbi:MAG: S8 family serine peptidase [Dokdonella sp.]
MKPTSLTLCLAAAFGTLLACTVEHAGAADSLRVTDADLQALATALAVDAQRLGTPSLGVERLRDGREIRTIKAIDRSNGEIVGRSFHAGVPIDPEGARHEANLLWRFAHGAMTPAMLERLKTLRADERVVVDLWYAFTPSDDAGGTFASVGTAAQTSNVADVSQYITDNDKSLNEAQPLRTALAEHAARIAEQAANVPIDAATRDAQKHADPALYAAVLTERDAAAVAAVAAMEAGNQARIAALQMSMAPVRSAMMQKLTRSGIDVIYASDIVPSAIIQLTRAQLEIAARWPETALVDPEGRDAGPSLDVARVAHNAAPQDAVGYNGDGVTVAVVEGGRVYAQNPFLSVAQIRDTGLAEATHSTGVAGVVASNHSTHRGMAPNATVISANGAYGTAGSLEAATDWAAARAQVMNHSWGFKNDATSGFNAFDRRLDHIGRYSYRLNVHAAGNFGATGCAQADPTIVYGTESPGRGYNTLTVGGFDDSGSIAWGDDLRYRCSATGWATGDGAGGAHEKPEIAAAAVGITSLAHTTSSTSPLSGGWTGTSFAAPAIAGIAANLIEANAQLAGSPVAARALLLVGALHQPAGAERSVSATASTYATENGPWWFLGVDGASFPRSYQVYATKGQHVRFAINWLSNVALSSGTYSNDRLPADLDLRAYRSNGTQVASSLSYNNPFELVDFLAPESDTYEFRVSQFGAWTGTGVPFAAAAWTDGRILKRGTWWSFDSGPGRQGAFYDVRPNDDYPSQTVFWRGVSLRSPNSADYDLELYDSSWFGTPTSAATPSNRTRLAASAGGAGAVDYIMIDGNHWPSANREYYRVLNFSGSGSYSVNAADFVSIGANSQGVFGPYVMDQNTSLFVVEMQFEFDSVRRIKLIPDNGRGNPADLALAMYRSDPVNNSTWAQPRASAVATADALGYGGSEQMRYRHAGPTDYLGLAVVNKTPGTAAQFYVQITPSALFYANFESD